MHRLPRRTSRRRSRLDGAQIGNFPRAFTRLSLIDAATTLDVGLDARTA